jgi:ribosomal-protein-alanine N-acetyltransferase
MGGKGWDTARLRLRAPEPDDAPFLSAMMTPAVSRWVASWPVSFSPGMAVERITVARALAKKGMALPLVVERRLDGVVLGWIGVARDAADGRRGSLGYWLGEEHQDRGYMREAAPATVAAAFETLGLIVIEAAAQPGNAASLAVLRGCGMVAMGERTVFAPARGRDELCHLYEVTQRKP